MSCFLGRRWYTVRPLQRVSRRLGMKLDLTVWDQFVDGRSGMRMVTFVSEPQALSTGGKVGPSPSFDCTPCVMAS